MTWPTAAQAPVLNDPKKIADWARETRDHLNRNSSIFAWREQRIILKNGNNNNIDLNGGDYVHIVGPTTPYTITGIGRGSPGRQVFLHNESSAIMTISELNSLSQAPNRIRTYQGDVTAQFVTLLWDHLAGFWILLTGIGQGMGILPVFEVPTPAPDDVTTVFHFTTSWSSNRLAFFRNGTFQTPVLAGAIDGQYIQTAPTVTMGRAPFTGDALFGIYWPTT